MSITHYLLGFEPKSWSYHAFTIKLQVMQVLSERFELSIPKALVPKTSVYTRFHHDSK
jgi:hypothetical protein